MTTIQLVYEFLTIYSLQKEECSSQCQQPQSTNLIRSEPNVSSNCNSPSLVDNLLMAATVFSLELLNCSQRLSSFSCMLDNSWSWKIVMKQTNINTHIQSWNNQMSSKVHLNCFFSNVTTAFQNILQLRNIYRYLAMNNPIEKLAQPSFFIFKRKSCGTNFRRFTITMQLQKDAVVDTVATATVQPHHVKCLQFKRLLVTMTTITYLVGLNSLPLGLLVTMTTTFLGKSQSYYIISNIS